MDKYDERYWAEKRQFADEIIEKVKTYKSEQTRLREEARKLSTIELTDTIKNSLDSLIIQANEDETAILNRVKESITLYGRQLKESLFVIDTLVYNHLIRTDLSQTKLKELRIEILGETVDNFSIQKKKADYLVKKAEEESKKIFTISLIFILIFSGLAIFGVWKLLENVRF